MQTASPITQRHINSARRVPAHRRQLVAFAVATFLIALILRSHITARRNRAAMPNHKTLPISPPPSTRTRTSR